MATIASKSEYAAMRGWSPANVTKLLKAGRLVTTPDGKRIMVEASDERIRETADPAKEGVRRRWAEEKAEQDVHQHTRATAPPPADDADDASYYNFQSARAKRETHLAKLAEYEEQLKAGKLLQADRVIKALTDNAAAMRAALERLPDRLSTVLAAESDPDAVYALLETEIGNLIDELRRVAMALPGAMSETQQ